jgi:hypothetical protein
MAPDFHNRPDHQLVARFVWPTGNFETALPISTFSQVLDPFALGNARNRALRYLRDEMNRVPPGLKLNMFVEKFSRSVCGIQALTSQE